MVAVAHSVHNFISNVLCGAVFVFVAYNIYSFVVGRWSRSNTGFGGMYGGRRRRGFFKAEAMKKIDAGRDRATPASAGGEWGVAGMVVFTEIEKDNVVNACIRVYVFLCKNKLKVMW